MYSYLKFSSTEKEYQEKIQTLQESVTRLEASSSDTVAVASDEPKVTPTSTTTTTTKTKGKFGLRKSVSDSHHNVGESILYR